MKKKNGNATSGVGTRVSDDRKLGVAKKSSDFRWANAENPAIDETKAEKLLKKEQKQQAKLEKAQAKKVNIEKTAAEKLLEKEQEKQVNIDNAQASTTWLGNLRNKVNLKRAQAKKEWFEKLKNKVELEKSLNPVFSAHFQWPRAYEMYVIATAMSVIALAYIINAVISGLTYGFGSLGVNLWIGIIALIDAVGLWKIQLPFRKIKSKDIKAFKGYLAVQKVLNVVSFVLCEILAGILLIASIALMIASDGLIEIIESGAFEIGVLTGNDVVINADTINGFINVAPTIFFLFALFISIVPAIVFTYYNRALKRFISYIDELTVAVESGIYRIENEPPYKSFMVLGGLSIVGALLPMYTVLWANLSEVLLSPAFLLSFFSGAMFGEYLIYTALLFRKLHRNATDLSAMLDDTADNELIEHCDPEMLCRNGADTEINE